MKENTHMTNSNNTQEHEMETVRKFIHDGLLSGKLPEAMHAALEAINDKETSSIQQALSKAAREWYI